MRVVFTTAEWVLLVYFLSVHGAYLLLDVLAYRSVRRSMTTRDELMVYRPSYGLEPPVSIIVPAFNEAATIVASVQALLQLDYPQFEIVVVSDGSTDATVAELDQAFALEPCPRLHQQKLVTASVREVYISRHNPMLRVVDKDNGGKADSLNAGLNVAQFALFCAVDADSILQRDSLLKVVRPFVDHPETVAAGGTIRILNGSEVRGGFLSQPRLPRHPVALIQVVEYMRAFLFGRVGWSDLGGVLIISGAFGLFRRETVVAVGGYRVDSIGEDAELVMRLHRHGLESGRRYRIEFVPDPICWTEAPEDLRVLGRQRIRWQRGLLESLMANRGLMRRPSVAGWAAFPFLLVFEGIGPVVELLGYITLVLAALVGALSASALIAFLVLAVGLGILLSMTALLLEERWFHTYTEPTAVLRLVLACVAENLGYRQLVLMWRVIGLVRFVRHTDAAWGHMPRLGSASVAART